MSQHRSAIAESVIGMRRPMLNATTAAGLTHCSVSVADHAHRAAIGCRGCECDSELASEG